MFNERKKIMKTTLRYLLSMVMVLSVLSVSAQTPKYGRIYTPSHQHAAAQVAAQMPVATMGSTSSELVSSGSSLPQAAVTGTTTTYDATANTRLGQIRRSVDDDDTGDKPEGWEDPYKDPIGDALLPLMLLACAYLIVRVTRRRAIAIGKRN
jgi:hypothetical protein